MSQLPIIPIFNYVTVNIKQNYVDGFYANKFDQHPLRYVTIDAKARKKQFGR